MKDKVELEEKWFVWEYVDDTGRYVKTKYREVEEYSFYLRFAGKWFTPCKECQRRLKQLLAESDDIILGNKDYEPPVEFRRRKVTDDESWIMLEERLATLEDEKQLGKWGRKRESCQNE
ncbi:MAG: hypothetical protein ACTSRS_22085 [Candidatus Helarchaeota archaeon]